MYHIYFEVLGNKPPEKNPPEKKTRKKPRERKPQKIPPPLPTKIPPVKKLLRKILLEGKITSEKKKNISPVKLTHCNILLQHSFFWVLLIAKFTPFSCHSLQYPLVTRCEIHSLRAGKNVIYRTVASFFLLGG